jgi:hypothetical protein
MEGRALHYCGSQKGTGGNLLCQENKILGSKDAGNFLIRRKYYFLIKNSTAWIYFFIHLFNESVSWSTIGYPVKPLQDIKIKLRWNMSLSLGK